MSAPIVISASVEQCADCGGVFPAAELEDTLAGWLCADCAERFIGSCRALIRVCASYVRLKEGA